MLQAVEMNTLVLGRWNMQGALYLQKRILHLQKRDSNSMGKRELEYSPWNSVCVNGAVVYGVCVCVYPSKDLPFAQYSKFIIYVI